MGANTTVYVRVLKAVEEWIEVQAVTLEHAENEAEKIPGVIRALESSYDRGDREDA